MLIKRTPYQRNGEKKQTFAYTNFHQRRRSKKNFREKKKCLMRIYCIWSALIKCWPNRLIYVFIDDENSSGSHCFCRTCIFSYFLHFHPMLLILYPIINLICFFCFVCFFPGFSSMQHHDHSYLCTLIHTHTFSCLECIVWPFMQSSVTTFKTPITNGSSNHGGISESSNMPGGTATPGTPNSKSKVCSPLKSSLLNTIQPNSSHSRTVQQFRKSQKENNKNQIGFSFKILSSFECLFIKIHDKKSIM